MVSIFKMAIPPACDSPAGQRLETALLEKPQIFEYKNLYDYLQALKKNFAGRKRALSYSQLAELLEYESPRTVAMAWTGKRPFSKGLLSKLRVKAKLNAKEYVYLELLVAQEKKREQSEDTTAQMQELHLLAKKYHTKTIPTRIFGLISKWEHSVVHELVQGKKRVSAKDLKNKIRGNISEKAINEAIENLLALKVLAYDENQGQFQECDQNLVVGQDIPSQAIVSHHQQILELAKNALTEQLMSDRDFTSHTLRFDPAKMDEAKEHIFAFVQEFNEKFFSKDAEEVYQLNVQLFSHTKPGFHT